MTLYFTVKSLSRKDRFMGSIPYSFATVPADLEALLRLLVKKVVADYNARLEAPTPLYASDRAIADMARHGKISFGLGFGDTPADEAAAIQTALEGFRDGLYRVFQNGTELTELHTPLSLQEGDSFTIIRLVMLTGSLL